MTRPEDFTDASTGNLSAGVTDPGGPTVHVEHERSEPHGDYYTGSPDLAASNLTAVDIRDETGTPIAQRALSQLPPQILETVTRMMINRDPATDIARVIREGMAAPDDRRGGKRKRA